MYQSGKTWTLAIEYYIFSSSLKISLLWVMFIGKLYVTSPDFAIYFGRLHGFILS